MEPEALFSQLDALNDKITKLLGERENLQQKIATYYCPFKAGDVLKTAHGLGTFGLLVEDVIPPMFFGKDNRWAASTSVMDARGGLTATQVHLEEKNLKSIVSVNGMPNL